MPELCIIDVRPETVSGINGAPGIGDLTRRSWRREGLGIGDINNPVVSLYDVSAEANGQAFTQVRRSGASMSADPPAMPEDPGQ